MKGNKIIVVALFSALLGGTLALGASGADQSAPPKRDMEAKSSLTRKAKISLEQARTIALKRAPGKIESGELERERGRLVYSFDIRNARGTITEVQVSAITGKIVSVKNESKEQEAAEQQKDKHAAKH